MHALPCSAVVTAFSSLAVLVSSGCGSADRSGSMDDADGGGVVAPDAGQPARDGGTDAATVDMEPRWTELTTSSPGPWQRWGFASAGIGGGRALVWGGTDASAYGGTVLDDVWLVHLEDGELQAEAVTATGPAPRYCICGAWDPARQRLVMTGGRDLGGPESVPDETWELSVDPDAPTEAAWTRIDVPESPDAPVGCAAAFAGGSVYLFGGASVYGYSDRTFRYDPETPAWVQIESDGPSARYDAGLRVLPGDESIVLYAGAPASSGTFYSDVWLFDTNEEAWTEVPASNASPRGRRVPWMVMDHEGTGFYAGLGVDGPAPLDDLWHFDLETRAWTEVLVPVAPPARGFTPAIELHDDGDGTDDGIIGVVMGGMNGADPLGDAWMLALEPAD